MDRAVVPIPAIFRCAAKSLSNVVPRPVSWVWQDWFPQGTLSLILGEPGIGKSFYALQLAAMVTRGWLQPPAMEPLERTKDAAASEGEQRDPAGGTVVLFDGGDGELIVQDRLCEMGACMGNVMLLSRSRNDDLPDEHGIPPFDPKDAIAKAPSIAERDREMRLDLRSLEHHVLKLRSDGHDVRLVIIDPIESLLRDSHDKGLLAKLLGELAARLDVAVVAVGIETHSKWLGGLRMDTKGIELLFQVARTVVNVVQDLENQELRMVLPTKLNLSAMQPGMKFSIAEGAVQWTNEQVHMTGHEYLAIARQVLKTPNYCEASEELDRVTKWLKEKLSNGAMMSVEVRSAAYPAEIGPTTLRKAFRLLGCRSNKNPLTRRWFWRLPGSTDGVWGTRFDEDPFVHEG